jgi:hypothetical protein
LRCSPTSLKGSDSRTASRKPHDQLGISSTTLDHISYFSVPLSTKVSKVLRAFNERSFPGKSQAWKNAAKSLTIEDVQGMLALLTGGAIDPKRVKDRLYYSVQLKRLSSSSTPITSLEFWKAVATEIGVPGS